MLDLAALYLSLCPQAAPAVPARLCLRSGLVCFSEVARPMGIKLPAEPAPNAAIGLTHAEFPDAVGRLRLAAPGGDALDEPPIKVISL